MDIVGFEVFGSSTTGAAMPTVARVLGFDAAGAPSVSLSTGTITFESTSAWKRASVTPVQVAAGTTFCVGFDTTAAAPSVYDATTGGVDVAYHRFENGVWGPRNTGRFEWCVRVLCRPTTRLSPSITAAGVMDAGQSFAVTMKDALPQTLGGIAIGASRTMMGTIPLPLPLDVIGGAGCWILSDQIVVGTGFVDASGVFALPIAIPNDPYFVGFPIYHQGVVVDPAANAMGFALTNGLEVRIGG
jgi:hypothetical protein